MHFPRIPLRDEKSVQYPHWGLELVHHLENLNDPSAAPRALGEPSLSPGCLGSHRKPQAGDGWLCFIFAAQTECTMQAALVFLRVEWGVCWAALFMPLTWAPITDPGRTAGSQERAALRVFWNLSLWLGFCLIPDEADPSLDCRWLLPRPSPGPARTTWPCFL